jgi:hypothetical protein
MKAIQKQDILHLFPIIISFNIIACALFLPGKNVQAQSSTSLQIRLPDTVHVGNPYLQLSRDIRQTPEDYALQLPFVPLPEVPLGFFCKFEDHINRRVKIRIDFGTD